MDLDGLAGRVFGPVRVNIIHGQVAEYIGATGDNHDRWRGVAPPSFASALLFAVAPLFLSDPLVSREVRTVLHGEQTYEWHRPLDIGRTVEVTGTVQRIRLRSGSAFITFGLTVGDGSPLVEGTSLFIATGEMGEPGEDAGEPAVDGRGPNETPLPLDLPASGAIAPLAKSASREDLVKYAAASHDWNPIHWDHQSAIAAGLNGVIVHGLLSAAWIMQSAARYGRGDAPLKRGRFRFRSPLRPADSAAVQGSVDEVDEQEARLALALASRGETNATAEVTVTR